MGFSEERRFSVGQLARIIQESNANGERFCFILGSGASVESGIPSGNTLEMRWMNCLMGAKDDAPAHKMNASETCRMAEALHKKREMQYAFGEIKAAWEKACAEGKNLLPSRYYFDIYKLRFYPTPRNGYSYLEKLMENCTPSLGYHTLAKLLTQNNLNNLVITTNFDSLVEDALFLYTEKRPLVVSHESLAEYMEANVQRPIVAKVHRGLMYAPLNSPDATNRLKDEWRGALRYAFNVYTPIVIGYAGGDHSLMDFLKESDTKMRNGLYWCFRAKSGLPEENILQFVQSKQGYFVEIDGFDALMLGLGKQLYGDAIGPSAAEQYLNEKNSRRIQKYNEQWTELDKNPTLKELVRSVNEQEQRGEEQREKKEELTATDHFRRGYRAGDEGDWATAQEEYSKAIEKDPSFMAAYNNRGILHENLKQYDLALADYNKALELAPDDADVYNNRGAVYDRLKHYDLALADYNKALELVPDDARVYNNRGAVYDRLKHYDLALADYTKALELAPDNAEAYNNRGVLYKNLKQYDLALANYNRALELAPDDAEIYNNRGILHENLKHYDLALADYNKALELAPDDADVYNNRGVAYDWLKQYDLALADYNKALELAPDDAEVYNNRGISHKNLKHYDLALADYNKALELAPDDAEAYNNRGAVYDHLKQYDLALADYNKALELAPDDAGVYNNRGVLYKNLKQYDLALADYTKALELNPNYRRAYRNRARVYLLLKKHELALQDEKKAEKLAKASR